jgi:hypothetical protein
LDVGLEILAENRQNKLGIGDSMQENMPDGRLYRCKAAKIEALFSL